MKPIIQLALALVFGFAAVPASAELPGKGVSIQPVQSTVAEETFQTLLVARGLEALGYQVKDIQEVDYAAGHLAIANGDATFMAVHWDPLHAEFFTNAGGVAKMTKVGQYISGALQGYLIDKKTAHQYKITNIGQLKDPKLAALFDANGDGKADLTGCTPGWGCEKVIEHQLTRFGLRDTVTHNQGSYAAIIADTIARYRAGKPILYYTWTPYWVSGVLVPGKDTVFIQVPFSALPGKRAGESTRLADGSDFGFQINSMHVVANKAFLAANPAANRLFEVMTLSIADISAQNLRMRGGENSAKAIRNHVDGWIRAHQSTFDGWIQQAKAAAK